MTFDFVVIGGGQAGIPLAHSLAQAERSTVLVEGKNLGGSCINFGCTPTKAAIASANLALDSKSASDFGLRILEVKIDFPEVWLVKREVSLPLRARPSTKNLKEAMSSLLQGESSILTTSV